MKRRTRKQARAWHEIAELTAQARTRALAVRTLAGAETQAVTGGESAAPPALRLPIEIAGMLPPSPHPFPKEELA